MKKPIIEVVITGFLPISVSDAKVLEYMSNISTKHYKDLLGSKFAESDYVSVLENLRKAAGVVLTKNKCIMEAFNEE